MKVYSWNVLFENRTFDRVAQYIRSRDADIICLQEVPENFLRVLKTFPYFIAYSPDVRLGAGESLYLVVLSKHPIARKEVIEFPDSQYTPPNIVGRILGFLFGWRSVYCGKTALLVDVTVPGSRLVQVVCAHLSVVYVSAEMRYKEFDFIMKYVDEDLPLLFCGDFNILEWPHVTLIDFIMGGSDHNPVWTSLV